jgi:hypothetical protein
MKTVPVVLVAIGTALSLCSFSSAAQSFRCKNDLVNVGATRASVLQKCGEPVAKDSFCKPVAQQSLPAAPPGSTTVNVIPCENVDEWTYNPGYGQYMTTLRFEAGELKSIKYGDRVK